MRPEPGGTQLRSVGINCRHLGVISSNYPKERGEQPDLRTAFLGAPTTQGT